ncbi:MAG TPA: hypothetical protein VGL57_14630 [Solirubrobacteraceae bacterium]
MNHLRSRAQQPGGRAVMRVKKIDVGTPLGALTALVVLCGLALTATSAFALNPERHYEQVSPAYKGGFGVGAEGAIQAVAQNGEGVAWYAPAAFSGAPAGLSERLDFLDYVSRRSSTGWSTEPMMPPDTVLPDASSGIGGEGNADISTDLGVTLALNQLGPSVEAATANGSEGAFFLHATNSPDVDADWGIAGPVLSRVDHKAPVGLEYLGGDADFCHLFLDEGIDISLTSGPEVLLEQAENGARQLYEVTRGCDGESAALRLVALDNRGALISPLCRADLGLEHFAGVNKEIKDAFNAVAADGQMAFFTTCIDNDENDHQLFVRLGGSRTLEVSRPLGEGCSEVPCGSAATRASANFVGASEDGSKVFFTTTAPLEPGTDKDTGEDLYLASIGCPATITECSASERKVTSLTQVSHSPLAGEVAEVQGAVRVAPDGERAYFVARGVLSEGVNAEGHTPVKGADNLYVYDSVSRQVTFIADLCSAHDTSGVIEDRRCPAQSAEIEFREKQLWLPVNGDASFAQTAGIDGSYLVFSSFGQLTSDDTDTARDVYRFDAVTDTLERVSSGENGYDSNGNAGEFDATIRPGHFGGTVLNQYEMNNRSMSEDGSRIVFTTAAPLSSAATNGLVNAYEWHENSAGGGSVSLLSGGNGSAPVEDVVISPGGGDVYFAATEGLVPQDVDGEADVYDARLGSGFASVVASAEPCSGDACQGPLTNPAPLLVPGSAVQAPGDNFPMAMAVKTTISTKAVKKCAKREHMVRQKCVKKKQPKSAKRRKTTSRRAGR